jgi:hypothetical protein
MLPFIVGRGSAKIQAVNSSWSSSNFGAIALRLVGDRSEALIRGCRGTNVTFDVNDVNDVNIESSNWPTLAIVNSTFEPPLQPLNEPARLAICSALVSGDQVCDARASCGAGPSGGIQCACTGDGLQEKYVGVPDGHECTQDTRVSMRLMSENTVVVVYKPSGGAYPIVVNLLATGETHVTLNFGMQMSRISGSSGCTSNSAFGGGTDTGNGLDPLAQDPARADSVLSTRSWSRIDELTLSLDGHHVEWRVAPSNDSLVNLDAGLKRFSVSKEYTLHVSANCHGEKACINDGESVETSITVGSSFLGPSPNARVVIIARIVSLVSCDKSKVRLEFDGETESQSSSIRVVLHAYDVDGQPINITRADVHFKVDASIVPHRWERGSNMYVADVTLENIQSPGAYTLVVDIDNAWRADDNRATSCELLHRVIQRSASAFQTSYLLAGAGTGAIFTIAVLVVTFRRHRKRLERILVMLFAEVAELVATFLLEVADLVTDAFSCWQVVFDDGAASPDTQQGCSDVAYGKASSAFRAAYACFFCLSTVAALIAFAYRIQIARSLHQHVRELKEDAVHTYGSRRESIRALSKAGVELNAKIMEYTWELQMTRRSAVMSSLTLLTIFVEDLPSLVVTLNPQPMRTHSALRIRLASLVHR